MKNIIIIGNGFDLAHGLKTGYSDFINDIKSNPLKYDADKIVNNKMLQDLLVGKEDSLWSDIECDYYNILTNLNNRTYLQKNYNHTRFYKTITELNNDFNEIKQWLCKYLENEELKFTTVKNYADFFNKLAGKDSVIVNFNYTKTVHKYTKDLNIELIHIHGELDNPENPIIFGFAAGNEESKVLLKENNNEYVRNIKKFNYLYTNNDEKIKKYLEESPEFNVIILGHSCGISDKLILSEILNSKNIHKIYPFYFKGRDGYFDTMVNIDRIIDDYSKIDKKEESFKKLASYTNSYEIPQSKTDYKLADYLSKILDTELPIEKIRKDNIKSTKEFFKQNPLS